MEIKRRKGEEKQLIEEAKATKRSVEIFNRNIISEYIDFLNNGKAHDELIKSAEKGSTMTNFVDIKLLFEEEKIYKKSGRWDNDYDKIKEFYDNKVYGQYNGVDYIFLKHYLDLIKELKLDDENNRRRI